MKHPRGSYSSAFRCWSSPCSFIGGRHNFGGLDCSVRTVHGVPHLCRPFARRHPSAKHCGVDGRADTAAAKSIGKVWRETGSPQRALGKKAPLSRRFKSDHSAQWAADKASNSAQLDLAYRGRGWAFPVDRLPNWVRWRVLPALLWLADPFRLIRWKRRNSFFNREFFRKVAGKTGRRL